MEWVKGIPITRFLREQKLDLREVLDLFLDVCSAVNHAHQKGIIHRDLKPSNILVSLVGDETEVKVIDFGIAKATQQQLTDKTLQTRVEQIVGTPAYMSPEQASTSGFDIDTRSDIYSLGILLYELTCGQVPFNKENLNAIEEIIQNQKLPFISKTDPNTTNFIYKCLKFNAKDRPTIDKLLQHSLFDELKAPKSKKSFEDPTSFIDEYDSVYSNRIVKAEKLTLLRVKKHSQVPHTLSPKKITNLSICSSIKSKRKYSEQKQKNKRKKSNQTGKKSRFFQSYRNVMTEKFTNKSCERMFSIRKTKISNRDSSFLTFDEKNNMRAKSANSMFEPSKYKRVALNVNSSQGSHIEKCFQTAHFK